MSKCECGCGKGSVGGLFMPGHDQRLRIALEKRVGGILGLRCLVDAADSYATGSSTKEELATCIQRLFARRV